MPIFEYSCSDCGNIWENIEVWKHHAPSKCPKCESPHFTKLIGTPHIRMDSDNILHSLPDVTPPLTELIDKEKPGCVGGYKELRNGPRELKEYERKKDKYGNSLWTEKRKTYFTGQSNRRSSGEGK